MKKYLLSFTIFYISCAQISAQGVNPTFAVGGKVGPNFSTITDNFDKQDSKIGFHVGVVGVMGFGKNGNSSLIGEILLNQKGGKNSVSGDNTIYGLDLPIMYRYTKTLKENLPLKLFFNAGPYVGMLLSRSATVKTSQQIGEFGFCGGGGLIYPLSIGQIFLEGRYSFALTNVVPETFERNRFTSISIGFIYNIKGKSQEDKDKKIDGGFE